MIKALKGLFCSLLKFQKDVLIHLISGIVYPWQYHLCNLSDSNRLLIKRFVLVTRFNRPYPFNNQ